MSDNWYDALIQALVITAMLGVGYVIARSKYENKKHRMPGQFKLSLTKELEQELTNIARAHNVTLEGLLRKWITLGLVVESIENDPEATIVVHYGKDAQPKRLVVWE